jgi:oxygen-independent coproporphyrinogen-3 oxidase
MPPARWPTAERARRRRHPGLQPGDAAAVNRIQSKQETRTVIDAARAHGFSSINVDLIFDLPR